MKKIWYDRGAGWDLADPAEGLRLGFVSRLCMSLDHAGSPQVYYFFAALRLSRTWQVGGHCGTDSGIVGVDVQGRGVCGRGQL